MFHFPLVLPLLLVNEPKPGIVSFGESLVALAPAAWCAELGEWLEMRRASLQTSVVALEDVLTSARGEDAPAKVKRYLFELWSAGQLNYALLIGDADTFPVRFMCLDRCTPAAYDRAFYPSDLYYADLAREDGSFDDWNAAREGESARYYGEVRGEKHKDSPINYDRISYNPEIAVGRWPVSTVEELRAIADKTVAWEKHLNAQAPRAVLLHADGWIDARTHLRAMANPMLEYGFAMEELFYGERDPSAEQLIALLKGGASMAVHVGHGTSETWDGCLGPANFGDLQNGDPKIFISIGCNTAQHCVEPPYESYLDEKGNVQRGTNLGQVFAEPPPAPAALQPGRLDRTGLGESLLTMPTGGAVAYYGCCTGAQPCALTLLEGLLVGVASVERPRLGQAWRHAISHYVVRERLTGLQADDGWYPPSIFFQGMKFMLYGDPALSLPRRP